MEYLRKGISKVKGTMNQVDLVTKLVEATLNETGLASISLLNELSSRTDNNEECKIIVKHCAKVLTLKPKLWKRIQRDLALIEHIIKTGSQDFLDQMKDERDKITEKIELLKEKSRLIFDENRINEIIDNKELILEIKKYYETYNNNKNKVKMNMIYLDKFFRSTILIIFKLNIPK